MPLNALESPYYKSNDVRHEQGDILRDVRFIEGAEWRDTELAVAERTLPYCVLLSQDCDLLQDFKNRQNLDNTKDKDKYLPTLLVCPAYPAQTFREGKHLAEMNLPMRTINSDAWKLVINYRDARYHYLKGDANIQVPDLVIDFKHYLTISRNVIYDANPDCYLATIEIIFREHLSTRFANFLCRIGLPD